MDPHLQTDTHITIHQATIHCIHRIVPLFDEYRRWYGMPGDLSGAQAFLVQRTINAESIVFYASLAESPVGFVQLYPLFSSISMAPVWLLNDLFVQESVRRHGIGSLLLESAAEFARQMGALRLELETGSVNLAAQQFYQQHGWKPVTGFQRFALELEA